MNKFRVLLLVALLSSIAAPSVAQPSNGLRSLLSATADDETAFELLQKSPVAFWRGMSRAEFDGRTTAKGDERVLRLGEFEFVAKNPEFDAAVGLVGVSVEYRNDDPLQIEAAFEAYRHALGGIKPDYEKSAAGTPQIPDLQFAMVGWKAADGSECGLARVHSYAAKAKNKAAPTAGVVTFAVRRR